jgi:NADPH:quinone reductase-like Zn-dependent oxidoreductase
VIVDTGGNRPLSDLRRVLTRRGRLILVGGETGGRLLGGSERSLRALLLSPLVRQKLATFIASENAADLVVLGDLIDAGKLAPAIERTYPLSEAAAAITHMQDGHARGKVVISV